MILQRIANNRNVRKLLIGSLLLLMIEGELLAQTVTYCSSSPNYPNDEDILKVTLGTLSNTSDCSTTGGGNSVLNKYSDYTGVAAPSLYQGDTYALSVQVGTCWGIWNNYTSVYIDYDQNGSFTDPGEALSFTAARGPH